MKYEGIDFNVKIEKYKTLKSFKDRFSHLWLRDPNREKKLSEVYNLLKLKK